VARDPLTGTRGALVRAGTIYGALLVLAIVVGIVVGVAVPTSTTAGVSAALLIAAFGVLAFAGFSGSGETGNGSDGLAVGSVNLPETPAGRSDAAWLSLIAAALAATGILLAVVS
jgi:hypothetical protein